MIFDPSVNASSLVVALRPEVTGTLTLNAPTTTAKIVDPGQTIAYTFSVSTGLKSNLVISDYQLTGYNGNVSLYKPDGTILEYENFYSSYYATQKIFNLNNIPAGTYTLRLTPPIDTGVGTVKVRWIEPIARTVSLDTPINMSLATGQTAELNFAGVTGQALSFQMSGLTTTPTGGKVSVQFLLPTGEAMNIYGSSYDATTADSGYSLPLLPLTGTYKIKITPYADVSFQVRMSGEYKNNLILNGTTQKFNTSLLGQAALYKFNATTGQLLKLVFTNNTFYTRYLVADIVAPDGSILKASDGAPITVSFYPGSLRELVLPAIKQSGEYIVRIRQNLPGGTAQPVTGSISLQLLNSI